MDQLPSTPASSDVASPQASSIGSPSPIKRTSTKRKILNAHQQGVLERHFLTENRLPSSATRSILANALGLSENTVRTWFTNRRAKQRRQDTRNARVSTTVQTEQISVTSSSPPTDAQYYSQNRAPCPPNCRCSSGYSINEQRAISPAHQYYNGAIVSEFSSNPYWMNMWSLWIVYVYHFILSRTNIGLTYDFFFCIRIVDWEQCRIVLDSRRQKREI